MSTSPLSLNRRGFLKATGLGALGIAGAAALSACGPGSSTSAALTEIRYALIGDGKAEPGTILSHRLGGFDVSAEVGLPVSFPTGFAASLPVMEAIKAGSIEFSFATATAVIYAIGGGVPVVPLVAYPLPENEVDILVHKGSDIKSAADLAGRRVADHQGTTGTYSLVKYLETAGLTIDDIEYVNLTAADAEAAFAQRHVDAWINWQPTIELARRKHDADVLPGVRTYDYAFFVASERFAFDHPREVATLVRNVRDAQRWIEANPETAVAEFAALGGFGDSTLEKDVYYDLVQQKRLSYSGAGDFGVIGPDAVDGTQDLADNFHQLGVYPEAVDVRGWFADDRFAPVADAVRAELSKS